MLRKGNIPIKDKSKHSDIVVSAILELKDNFHKLNLNIMRNVGTFYYMDSNGTIFTKTDVKLFDLYKLRRKIKYNPMSFDKSLLGRITQILEKAKNKAISTTEFDSKLSHGNELFSISRINGDVNYNKFFTSSGERNIQSHTQNQYKSFFQNADNVNIKSNHISLTDFPTNNQSSQYLTYYWTILLSLLIMGVYLLLKTYKTNQALINELNILKKQTSQKEQSISNMSSYSTNCISKLRKNLLPDSDDNEDIPILIDNFEGEYRDDSDYGEIFESKSYKSESSINMKGNNLSTDLSMISILSQASQTSRKSFLDDDLECSVYSHNISSKGDFNEKIKLPYLLTSFNLRNRTMSDISSITDCYVEEKEDKLIKTEIRKVVTIYEKPNNTQVDIESSESQSIELKSKKIAQNKSFDLTCLSMIKKGLRLDAKLSHDNLVVSLKELNHNSFLETKEENISLDKLIMLLSETKMDFNEEELTSIRELHNSYLISDDDSKQMRFNRLSSREEKLKCLKDIISESNSLSSSYEKLPIENRNNEIFDNDRFVRNFTEFELIGCGGFGNVFKAKHRIDDGEYAIKVVKLYLKETDNLSDQEVVKEAKLMMKINNKRIVRYITCWFESNGREVKSNSSYKGDSSRSAVPSSEILSSASSSLVESNQFCNIEFMDYQNPKGSVKSSSEESFPNNLRDDSTKKLKVYFYMQMEYCNGFPLSYYLLHKTTKSNGKISFYIFKEILLGLYHIHNNNIIHRDLKPANIFIHDRFEIKIGDFGLAEEVRYGQLKDIVGTQIYQSPEQVKGKEYDHKVDIYSLGLIYLEILCRFSTQSERRFTLDSVRESIYPSSIELNFPSEFILIKMMTCIDPKLRPDLKEILSCKEFYSLCKRYEFL